MAKRRRYGLVQSLPMVFILLALACSLPTAGKLTPTARVPTQAPTPSSPPPTPAAPLPPAVIQSDPPPGAELSLDSPVTLYFNQPMDRASVEAALTSQPGGQGQVSWKDDAILTYAPQGPLPPDSDLALQLGAQARSSQGVSLQEPLTLTFHTAGYLQLAQSLPAADAEGVDPSSAVVAAFNRPVVPLGGGGHDLPPAFQLQPEAKGRAEWLNTSTYIFYPQPALQGGQTYTVQINPGLHSAAGGPLESATSWSFTTAQPRLDSLQPKDGQQSVGLDAPIVLSFNQPMDAQSVQANFQLTANEASVPGELSWNAAQTVFTYTASSLLPRNAQIHLSLGEQTRAAGGTPLGAGLSASFTTVPSLFVYMTEPAPGGQIDPQSGPVFYFSAPIQEQNVLQFIDVSPAVPNLREWWDASSNSLRLQGDFAPSTDYLVHISGELQDVWGGSMSEAYTFNFRTGPLSPNLQLNTASDVIFLTPQDRSLDAQVTNLNSLPVSLGSLPLEDFLTMLGQNGYAFKQQYRPADQRSWVQTLNISPDKAQPVQINLSPDGGPLQPGLYFLRFPIPQTNVFAGPYLLVVSNLQLTFKHSATDALVWAVGLRNNRPVSGADVDLYNQSGQLLASGQTGQQGALHASIPTQNDPYQVLLAVSGQPGQENFALALDSWDQGISSWDFGVPADFSPPHLKVYLYTDRPIYRPGQTVYFRAVVRQAANGRYSLPDLSSLPLTLYGAMGEELASLNLPLSGFGTAHGEFSLPEGAAPGEYSLRSTASNTDSLGFQVADYRKPEIDLQVSFAAQQALIGQSLQADVNARYFFDAPAGDLPFHWALYARPTSFDLPGYQVGPENTGWLVSGFQPFQPETLGELLAEGDGKTGQDGTQALHLPAPQPSQPGRQVYTLEITAKDESGLPVSARASLQANPAAFYIGLRPDAWLTQAGQPSSFAVQVVDWEKAPGGVHSLRAEFDQVEWVRQPAPSDQPYFGPSFKPKYTPIASTDFVTNEQGQARLAFNPTQPGTYQVTVSGGGARTALILWVGGAGQAVWPNLPNQRLHLIADRVAYHPGDTAQVFVPNPFGAQALGLVTLERGEVLDYQVVSFQAGGATLSLPLGDEDAPNVFVSVTLLGKTPGGRPDFRQGLLSLQVEPVAQILQVNLTSQPQRLGPGQPVTFNLAVTDSQGNPVQGEFSLSVVDLAALSLADPNSTPIVPAFYGEQPLGVRTSLDLAAYAYRLAFIPQGIGGGGGGLEVAQVVRQNFPDTAFWSAEIRTDPDGKAQVTVDLPDTLTTWQVDLRGLTQDTRVGQAEAQVVTTKDLLVRPVTPRFLVMGDHLELAAVVHNNTAQDLQTEVALQAGGVDLDDPGAASQSVTVPAGGRVRVSWWGRVQDADFADLVFSARAGDLQDASRPEAGMLPILHADARQAFRTSGVLDEGGERLELVSLPPTVDLSQAGGGSLDLELSSSLAASLLDALPALDQAPYACNEQTLSRLLSNLETYRTLQQYGIQAPALKARLDGALQDGLQRLEASQNADGGWGWCKDSQSDAAISAYLLFGLTRAQQAGVDVNDDLIRKAVEYLQSVQAAPQTSQENWELDQAVFTAFALQQAGHGSLHEVQAFFAVRSQLSPWSQALLALTLESLSPGSEQSRALISDLETSALRSASGAHWAAPVSGAQRNLITGLSNSAIVVFVLAQRDPGTPLLADAARYLMASRQANGSWPSSYSAAWSILALNQVMRATGELGGNFTFSATLNGVKLASGQAGGSDQPTSVAASAPLAGLRPDYPNALLIGRTAGAGRLYYTAGLEVSQPVGSVTPLSQGITISRSYYPPDCPQDDCAPLQSAQTGQKVVARLALTLPQDAYHLVVEDYLPAGAEVLDTSLKTSQLGGENAPNTQAVYDPHRPFQAGWGWWYFHIPQIFDDHIAWAADYLPAGSYELTYTLTALQSGEFGVLPARAWQVYFPEVQGNSAGALFVIHP